MSGLKAGLVYHFRLVGTNALGTSRGADAAFSTLGAPVVATGPVELGSLSISSARVNGTVKQRSSTAKMIFSVAEMVAYYARVLTLEVGDVIATGTPAGVGAGAQPPEFLGPGDVVEVEIGELGTLATRIGPSGEPVELAIRPL